jgi:hypothetical protein
MSKKFALIDQDSKVGQVLIADSIEYAEELAESVFYGIVEVVEVTDQENADKLAIGCGWDGEAFIPLPGTELDELFPTTITVAQVPSAE